MRTWIADLEQERQTLERMIANRLGDDSPSVQASVAQLRRRLDEVNRALEDGTRPLVRVQINGDVVRGHEIKIDTVGPLLDELQETLSSIGQALEGSATTYSSIPGEIREQTSLVLSAVQPGSVVLQLRAVADPRVVELPLFGEIEELPEPLGISAINRFLKVADLAARENLDDTQLIEDVFPLGARTYKHLGELTKIIVDHGIDADFTVISPIEGEQQTRLSVSAARRIRDVLRRTRVVVERHETVGELKGVSSVRNAFELVTPDLVLIRGKVIDDLVPALREWYERRVTAHLEVTIARSETTGLEYRRYLLLGLADPPRHE